MRKVLLILLISFAAHAQFIMHADFPAAPTSTLSTGLISFWKLDETSGTRYDAVGSNNLADNNTVTYNVGVIGNSAKFTASNSEWLSKTDNEDLSFANEDFTISAWVYRTYDATGYQTIVAKGFGAEYGIYSPYSKAAMQFRIDTTGYNYYVRITSGFVLNTWTLFTAWYNMTTDSIYIQMNNGTPNRTYAPHSPKNGTAAFQVGKNDAGYWDGFIDLVAVWRRSGNAITGKATADSIYNGGAGWQP